MISRFHRISSSSRLPFKPAGLCSKFVSNGFPATSPLANRSAAADCNAGSVAAIFNSGFLFVSPEVDVA